MKKVGTHRTLELTNMLVVSGEVARTEEGTNYAREAVQRPPRVPRWLVLHPVGEVEWFAASDATMDSWMRDEWIYRARGLWDAVFIGRRNRPRRRG